MAKYLREAFSEFDIKIVCYLRCQWDVLESSYNQIVKSMLTSRESYETLRKNGIPFNLNTFVRESLESPFSPYNYYDILAIWAGAFGKENIIIRPFEKKQLPNGIEYNFFVNVLGKSPDFCEEIEIGKRVNESVNKEVLEYKMATQLWELSEEFWELSESQNLPDFVRKNGKKIYCLQNKLIASVCILPNATRK